MFRRWLASHRSLVASATSGTVVAALVATVAIVSTGYTAQRLDLGDGSVWVANSQQQAIGRANTEVLELNSVVATTGNDIDVLQQGETVLLFDRSENTVDIVDPATSQVSDSVALPPNQPELFLAGENVVVLERGTGEVWIVSIGEFADFDAESEASLSLGTDAIVSVDPDGLLFAYSPATGQLYSVDAAVSDTVQSTQSVDIPTSTALSISSTAGRWAVLDADAELLYLDGRQVDLSGLVGQGTGAVLQWPAATGDRVLVAYSGGLVSVPLSGAAAVGLVAGKSGIPARPLTLEGCEYAAWTDGDNWRRCAGDSSDGRTLSLASMAGNARLSFVTNGTRAVLNDARSGETWAVQRGGELIDNWDDLIVVDDNKPEEQQNDENLPPEIEKVQEPPVAVDDAFGARPGRATVLPVLLNDYDANGDVLVVSELTPIAESVGRIDLINERQQIQLTLAPGVVGSVSFEYTITDGRGGSATATVVITIRQPTENSPPEQVRSTAFTVQSAGRVTTQVLGDWVDPDGDAFYLTSAVVAAPDAVTYKPEGTIVFSDSGDGSDLKIVTLVVSDGTAESSGSASVTVKPAGEVPIVADPFVMLAYSGQEITVSPLEHVRGGTGTIRLNSVPSKADVTITPSYETGTFRFTSDQLRSHYLEYVVTDGTQTVTGLVRIDVASPPNANTRPITVPKTVFVKTLHNERIDVAGTDVDPAGGVLLVTGIMNLPTDSGVRAEVLEQRIVRVSLEAPLDDGPVTFNYRISNGLAEAEGVITVVEIPTPTRVQPPVANDDSVTVRVGEAIDIPVLENDEHPDGLDLTLQPRLDQQLPADSGLLFASGRVLRYLAPEQTGNFTAAYQVTGPDGQAATALVRIAVREADVATNNAPVPDTVTARVIAGETVRVRIPLSGIDPDGDSVQLLGQSTNPEKGSVISVESDTIVYQAGDYSAGTDTFEYTVIDSLGARATGTVRVGISPRLEGARNPVAIVDEVTVRPGFTVSVQVLANDSDPDGSPLTVVSAEPNDSETTAEIIGDVVDVTPPRAPGSYGVIYSIENDKGGTSQNFIRVTVDPDAPLSYPQANDSVLTLSDVLDRDRVTVDVLANVFFADGDARSLGLSIYPGYGDSARVTSNKRIEVSVGNRSQIIPFKVTHPDDPDVFSYAFIRVPGYDDALPQLDRRAPALVVNSEDQLVIDLNDYVIAVGGKQVRLTDSGTVQATHSDGSNLVRDENTLVFTSADKYFGPASISFEVTDGSSAADPAGRTAILVLPITVRPRENQPPAFDGAVLEFEPGQEREIDLLRLTTYPYPDDLDELAYTVLSPLPEGFTYDLSGNILTLTADDGVAQGAVTSMSLGVRDGLSEGQAGRIELRIVPSTRPLVKPAADTAVAKRGDTTVVDVLANDEATNPFPNTPLRVVAIRGLDGGTLPPGVQIEPSADRQTLTVTISSTAEPIDVNLQYEVADSTNDPSRYVWGMITVSVQDRPDPVANLFPSGFDDREITMRWNAGPANNSPITNYRVTSSQGGVVVATQDCTGTTCSIPTPGNGPANSVIVTVVATNAIGDSDPVTLADDVWSDIIPPAPTVLGSAPLDRGLRLTWNQVSTPSGGSPVDRYHIAVGAFSTDVSPGVCGGGVCTWDTSSAGWLLDNGVAVNFTISPRNAAYTALSVWNTSEPRSDVPAGPPIAVGSPLATVLSDTLVQLEWAGVFTDNGRAIANYTAAAYTGAAPTCSPDGSISSNGAAVASAGTGTWTQFSGLSPNATYTLVVFAFNGQGCTVSPAVVAHTPPAVITALSTSMPATNGSGLFDVQVTGGSMGGDALTNDYSIVYRLSGGSVPATAYGPVPLDSFLTAEGLQYGQAAFVEVRACRTWDSQPICQSTWSTPFPIATPVNANASGIEFVNEGNPAHPAGTFDWLGWPAGAYEGVAYACGASPGGTFVPADTTQPGSCTVDAGMLGTPYLTIRVTANGGQFYDVSYNGFDYDN
ncbi:MAG: fibronectin type protein [Rhodoglobus sp.]|nr:fibronectin type protein [Rhodoglobus sp.]